MAVDWSQISNWGLVLPPNRPSEELMHQMRLTLSYLPANSSICILGSTPEFRTLCRGFNFSRIFVIDKSPEFSSMCDRLTAPHTKETKLFGDWLQVLPEFDHTFDAVLTHLTHGNITFGKRSLFFDLIRKCLKPDGILIDFVFQPIAPGYGVQQVIQRFRFRTANLRTFNDFNSIALFQSSAIHDVGCVDTTAIYDIYENANLPDEIQLIVQGTKYVTPPGQRWYYDFQNTPPGFRYFDGYETLVEIPEPESSPFVNAASLFVLRKL